MNEEFVRIQKALDKLTDKKEYEVFSLYPGIDLWYVKLNSAPFPMQHNAMEHILQINYCESGQMAWKMKNGSYIYLNSGDYSLHTMDACAHSHITFPNGQYSGVSICIDLQETSVNPPELLKDTDIFQETLRKKFCRAGTVSFFAGNEQTECIFSGFYHQPEALKSSYQKIKVLELLLYLSKLELTPQNQLTACKSEQMEIIREIHDRLIQNIGERITIEELSKQYLINSTTLKSAFKTVYGTSIAAHIKEHRMKKAAEMLRVTEKNIAEIAQTVGYDSQSKFTTAFKDFFGVLPREYKKNFRE